MGTVKKPFITDMSKGLFENGIKLPLVSVIVTSFNYEKYIGQCLESIKRQSYQDFECVVVDDASSDNSVKLVRSYIEQHELNGQFSVLALDKNEGQMGAFKAGLQAANGTFIVYVDADDILMENFIEVHLSLHLSVSPVAFSCSNQYQINECDELIGGGYPGIRVEGSPVLVTTITLFSPAWVWATTSSMMFRKAVLETIIPDNVESYRYCADNYICHFANLLGKSILLPQILGCYRRHGENGFSKNPLIGGATNIGDMRSHPEHSTLKKNIINHIKKNYDDFVMVLTEKGLAKMMARFVSPKDLWGLLLADEGACSSGKFKVWLFTHFVWNFLCFNIKKYTNPSVNPSIQTALATKYFDG